MARRVGFGDSDEGTSEHPALITTAAESIEDQHRARVRRYLTIMSFRIPCLFGAGIAYSSFDSPLAAIIILAASIPLPWMAVLIANDRPPRKRDEPSLYRQTVDARAIESGARPHLDT